MRRSIPLSYVHAKYEATASAKTNICLPAPLQLTNTLYLNENKKGTFTFPTVVKSVCVKTDNTKRSNVLLIKEFPG